jgi:hypothetical protein
MKFVLMTAAVLAVATPALAEDWHPYSRTSARVYLADVDSILTTGSTTSIRAATTPLGRPATDLSHGEEVYEFDCAGSKWRTAGAKDFAADGTLDGDYPEEGAAWEPLRPNTVPDFLKQIACDGTRASGTTYPSVRAFIEAGRP